MTAKPWFDRLTTLSKVEWKSSHFNSFWTQAFAGVTGWGLFTKPSFFAKSTIRNPKSNAAVPNLAILIKSNRGL